MMHFPPTQKGEVFATDTTHDLLPIAGWMEIHQRLYLEIHVVLMTSTVIFDPDS